MPHLRKSSEESSCAKIACPPNHPRQRSFLAVVLIFEALQSFLPGTLYGAYTVHCPVLHGAQAVNCPLFHSTQTINRPGFYRTQAVNRPGLYRAQAVDCSRRDSAQTVYRLGLYSAQTIDCLGLSRAQAVDRLRLRQCRLDLGLSYVLGCSQRAPANPVAQRVADDAHSLLHLIQFREALVETDHDHDREHSI